MRRYIALLLLLAFPLLSGSTLQQMQMRVLQSRTPAASSIPITFNSKAEAQNGSGPTVTASLTVAAGDNRVAIAHVCVRDNSACHDISGVTFNTSESFTQIGTQVDQGTVYVSSWYLVNPTVTTANVVASCDAGSDVAAIHISVWNGVHQTTPVGTKATATGTVSNPATVTASSSAGDIIVDGACIWQEDTTMTISGDQDAELNQIDGVGADNNEGFTFGSSWSDSVNPAMTWTLNADERWATAAVPLKPANP